MDLKNILKTIKLNEGTISMILGGLVIVVVGILVINYFRSIQGNLSSGSKTTSSSATTSLPQEHTVAVGEILWKIAEKYYGSGYNWVDIAKENKLTDANKILVGQKLTIPKAETKVAKETAPNQGIAGGNYTVVKGDHLWAISIRAYGDGYQWVKIAKASNLKNPDKILVGQVLNLPR